MLEDEAISGYKNKWRGQDIVKLITCPLIKLQFYLGSKRKKEKNINPINYEKVRFELLRKRSRNTNWSLQNERSRLKAHNLSIFPYHEVTELKRSTKMCV